MKRMLLVSIACSLALATGPMAAQQGDVLTMEPSTDRMGGDYRRIEFVPSVESCQAQCLADKDCDAYTYVKSVHHCWLKRGTPSPTPNKDTVSGVKTRPAAGGNCDAVAGMTCEPNVNRGGADYRQIWEAASVGFCQRQCLAEEKCSAYTYVRSARHCWLKDGVPTAIANNDTVSGVKLRGAAVSPTAPPVSATGWTSVGTGDCPGRDVANSTGPNPDPSKCTSQFAGFTAVCWAGGCTYKNLATGSCTGGGNPGRMYTCSAAAARPPSPPPPVSATGWTSVGTGDCPGRDVANSTGPNPDPSKCTPQFAVPGANLCLGRTPSDSGRCVNLAGERKASGDRSNASYLAASLAAVTGWVNVPTMGDFPFAHLA